MQSQRDQHLGQESNNASSNGDPIMREQAAKLQQKYGTNLPVFTKSLLGHQTRKYFDSGDYALSMAGSKETTVGSGHPQPEDIPHSVPVNPIYGSIPARRGSLDIMSFESNSSAGAATGGHPQAL